MSKVVGRAARGSAPPRDGGAERSRRCTHAQFNNKTIPRVREQLIKRGQGLGKERGDKFC